MENRISLFRAIAPDQVEQIVATRPVSPDANWTHIANVTFQTLESVKVAQDYCAEVAEHTERRTKWEFYDGHVAIYAAC